MEEVIPNLGNTDNDLLLYNNVAYTERHIAAWNGGVAAPRCKQTGTIIRPKVLKFHYFSTVHCLKCETYVWIENITEHKGIMLSVIEALTGAEEVTVTEGQGMEGDNNGPGLGTVDDKTRDNLVNGASNVLEILRSQSLGYPSSRKKLECPLVRLLGLRW